jgi:hypothetical protein
MNRELVQWQIIDESCGCVFPWFTHPFLEVIKKWDLSNKRVLEYGGGRSTIWWAYKAKQIECIETSGEWVNAIIEEAQEHGLSNIRIFTCPCREGETDIASRMEYITVPRLHIDPFDIVVVDGILRYECMRFGIDLLKRVGGILIVDNWQQDGFVCPACADLVEPYKGNVYRQEDHTDHHGNPWQTAYWEIPADTQNTYDYYDRKYYI